MKTMHLTNRIALAASLVVAIGLQGCAGLSSSPDVYTHQQAQTEQSVRMGTVESVRPVKIQVNSGRPSGLGAIAGGALGAVAGSAIGGGRGALLSGIAGGTAGAVAGNAFEGQTGVRNGVEITVRLDDGKLRAVTQEVTREIFRVGERVRLLTANGITRVTH